MKLYSVEKLASLCKVDRETIRRWRNRGVNGVKLEARQSASQRGTPMYFDEDAVRTFMTANPKYLTRELDESLNPAPEREASDEKLASWQSDETAGNGYVEQMLLRERAELQRKLDEIDRTLSLLRGGGNG